MASHSYLTLNAALAATRHDEMGAIDVSRCPKQGSDRIQYRFFDCFKPATACLTLSLLHSSDAKCNELP